MKNQLRNNINGDADKIARRLILSDSSSFVEREAYKTLRTNIRFALRGKHGKKICITSSAPGEGKSITILNLAISFAEAGKKVLLIDADLRRPAIARLLREKPKAGLTNVLAELADVEEAIRKEVYPNLDILFSGDIPPNPLELLSSEKMQEMIADMEKIYDYILVDTPPATIVSDACVVATLLDGVLFLARSQKSNKDNVRQAIKNLQLVGAKVLGFVLNGVDVSADKGYYGSYE